MFVAKTKPKSLEAEIYKNLRASLEYSSVDTKSKVIVIASPEKGDGKSITAGNLAISIAEDGKKTLLIDSDLRAPKIKEYFNIENCIGLADIINNNELLNDAINGIYENLSIITAGKVPDNPSEILGSESMKIILNKLREEYQYIILDSPPILAVSDSLVLSNISDGYLLVVRAEKTKRSNIVEAKKRIDSVNGKIIGSILNGAEVTEGSHQSYYRD